MKTVSFPSLAKVTAKVTARYAFKIIKNAALTSISFPKLAESANSINVYDNPSLKTLSFPSLVKSTSSSLYLYSNAALTSISFPKLAEINRISVYDNPSLKTLSFPSLVRATRPASGVQTLVLELTIRNNAALTSISFPKAEDFRLIHVYNNPLLTKLSLPSVRRVAYGTVTDQTGSAVFLLRTNPKLAVLECGALREIKDPLQAYNNGPGLDCTKLRLACGQSTQDPSSRYACTSFGVNNILTPSALNLPGTKDHGKNMWGHKLQTC